MIVIEAPKPELADAFIMDSFISYRGRIADLSDLRLHYELEHISDEYNDQGMLNNFESVFMNAVVAQAQAYHNIRACDYDSSMPKPVFETDEDYAQNMASENAEIRALVARNGKFLLTLMKDSDSSVRRAVVSFFTGQCVIPLYENVLLDELVGDKDWSVREAVANTAISKYLDILRNDSNEKVIAKVIRYSNNSFALTYAKSESIDIRCAVAKTLRRQELESTNLINDDEFSVRYAIASRGFFPEHFKQDCDSRVRDVVKKHEMPF